MQPAKWTVLLLTACVVERAGGVVSCCVVVSVKYEVKVESVVVRRYINQSTLLGSACGWGIASFSHFCTVE
jgi:hypothetical protein